MTRLLTIVSAVLIAVVVATGLLWYLTYGINQTAPRRATVDHLETAAEVGWHNNGFATISAQSEHDRQAALGYVHGHAHSWSLMLWRQAALGRLGEWFGSSTLGVDSLARQLGFASLAQSSYDDLSTDQQASLQAYTSGLNAALNGSASQLDHEITLLDVEPKPWKPWHTLALERLFAWLSTTPPPTDSLQSAGAQAQAFFQADRHLRHLLHLHSFQESAAWVMRDSSGTRLHRRLVHGNSALPVFQEVAFQQSDSTYLMGATVPGMPFLWAGQSPDQAWTILPKSTASVERGTWADSSAPASYERMAAGDSVEYLLHIRRQGGVLPFGTGSADTSPAADSSSTAFSGATFSDTTRADTLSSSRRGWLLRWPGLKAGTDLAAWQALTSGPDGSFQLQRGDGLVLQRGGGWQVAGSPQEHVTLQTGVVVGNTPWIEPLAASLDTLAHRAERSNQTALPKPTLAGKKSKSPLVATECYSAWAAQHAPELVAALDSVQRQPSDRVQAAISYLQNWNYEYSSSSIAASLYDTWAAAHRTRTGHLPGRLFSPDTAQTTSSTPAAPIDTAATASSDTARTARADTLNAAYRRHVQQYQTFVRVVDSLAAQFGNDLSTWRWERINTDRRFFPVWSADSLGGQHAGFVGQTRYAPLELTARGHPTSPCWGGSPIQRGLPASASWEGVTSTSGWDTLRVQKRAYSLSGFMDRYLISDHPAPPLQLRPFAPPKRTTTLSPPAS